MVLKFHPPQIVAVPPPVGSVGPSQPATSELQPWMYPMPEYVNPFSADAALALRIAGEYTKGLPPLPTDDYMLVTPQEHASVRNMVVQGTPAYPRYARFLTEDQKRIEHRVCARVSDMLAGCIELPATAWFGVEGVLVAHDDEVPGSMRFHGDIVGIMGALGAAGVRIGLMSHVLSSRAISDLLHSFPAFEEFISAADGGKRLVRGVDNAAVASRALFEGGRGIFYREAGDRGQLELRSGRVYAVPHFLESGEILIGVDDPAALLLVQLLADEWQQSAMHVPPKASVAAMVTRQNAFVLSGHTWPSHEFQRLETFLQHMSGRDPADPHGERHSVAAVDYPALG